MDRGRQFLSMRQLLSLISISFTFIPTLNAIDDRNESITYYGDLIFSLLDSNYYDKRVPPSFYNNTSKRHEPVLVMLDAVLYRMLGIEENLESITAYFFVSEVWTDPRLRWDPEKYGNITELVLHINEIWTPDTRVSGVLTMNEDDQSDKTHVRVNYTGMVSVMYPTIMQEVCPLQLQGYPFDDQWCSFYINAKMSEPVSVVYDAATEAKECNMKSNLLLEQDSEWILKDCYLKFYNEFILGQEMVGVMITLLLRRQFLYHIMNLLAPAVAIAFLNTVGLFINIEAESSELEAADLGMTSLLALSVLLLTASDQMPKGSTSISLLGLFYILIVLQTMGVTFISMVLRSPRRRACIRNTIQRILEPSSKKIRPINKESLFGRMSRFFSTGCCCLVANVLFIVITTCSITLVGLTYRRKEET